MSSRHVDITKLSGKQIELEKGSLWTWLGPIGVVLALIGIGGGFAAGGAEEARTWYALLAGYTSVFALGLGGLFFCIIAHLVRIHWGIVPRRLAENLAITLPLTGLVGLLMAFGPGTHHVYEWTHHEVPYETTSVEECGAANLAQIREVEADLHGHHHAKGAEHDEFGGRDVRSGWVVSQDPVSCFKKHSIEDDEMLSAKRPYLNINAFRMRTVIFYLILSGWAFFYWRNSTWQDGLDREKDRDKIFAISERMRWWAPLALACFALSMTFGAFDMLMSLDPHWFSTIFGVYYFAGGALSMFSFMAFFTALLLSSGYLKDVLTVDHTHDFAKYMFGFTVFWAYIGFSQYFLIWYADIPEETHWFHYRGEGDWMTVSLLLVFGRFVVPWFILLRRTVKRSPWLLAIMGTFVVMMEYVDMFFLTGPARAHHESVAHKVHALKDGNIVEGYTAAHEAATTVLFGAPEILMLLGMAGLFLAGFGFALAANKIVPVNDPRFAESVNHENLY